MYLISYGTDTTSMVHRCESHSSFFREIYCVPWLLTYLLFYCTYNSFTLPFQGRTLNTHAAEANLHRFPLPQAPGWGAIQFLTTISKCKVARNFRPDFRFSENKYHTRSPAAARYRNRIDCVESERAIDYSTLTRLNAASCSSLQMEIVPKPNVDRSMGGWTMVRMSPRE